MGAECKGCQALRAEVERLRKLAGSVAHAQAQAWSEDKERLEAEVERLREQLGGVDAFLAGHFRVGPQTPSAVRAAIARHQARQERDEDD